MSKINLVQDKNITELFPFQLPFFDYLPRQKPVFDLPGKPEIQKPNPSKPILVPPELFLSQTRSVFTVISRFLDKIKSIEGIYFDILDKEMTETHESISSNLEMHFNQQNQILKATESGDYWDFLRKVAVCLLGAASIVLGATLLTSGAPALTIVSGISMILSGTASIVGNILSDMNTHPKLSAALMIAGSGFGLIGGISCAISGIGSLTSMLGKVAVAGLSIIANSSNVIKEIYEFKISNLNASYSNIQMTRETSEERYRTMKEDLGQFERLITESTGDYIEAQMRNLAAIKRITSISGSV